MEPVEYLLEQLADETDPRALRVLLDQAGELGQDPRVRAEALWWDARYLYTNRKKDLLQDRFVWMLLMVKSEAATLPGKKGDPLVAEYREAICTPELEAAMAAQDDFYNRFLESAVLYTESLRQRPAIFGIISPGADKSKAALHRRIAEQLVDSLLSPIASRCQGQPLVRQVCRAIYDSAQACYPGIQPVLDSFIAGLEDPETRVCLQEYVAAG